MIEHEEVMGVFIGLESSSYEYIANIIAPYKADFPIEIGCFLLIQDSPNKLVARVIDFVPQGELTSFMGQKWLSDVALDAEAIGSDIKRRKISYSVKIKILGTLDEYSKFKPGLRRIPHITSRVVKASSETIKKIVNQALEEQQKGQEIGTYFLDDSIKINFKLSELDSKRTFVFARAGYGKSNFMKIIASHWNKDFGSLVVFDPEGEYAFTVRKGQKPIPGVMDKRPAILITNRKDVPHTNNVYQKLKLNLKDLPPQLILPLVIPSTKHENTIFFPKLMGIDLAQWHKLVDLLYDKGWNAPLSEINSALNITESEESDMKPIRNNLVPPIKNLHDPESKLLGIIEKAIKEGQVIIIDISLLDSKSALWLSSIIVRYIFNKNQDNYIVGGKEDLMKATFVVEEAQSVFSESVNLSAFIDLAKEGRKYLLGGIFVTQQPSSIPFEILSQADNFFVFHLLSKGDLDSLYRANAHYSNDVATQLLNEPVKGKCYMWTSSQPFVIPIQIINFETETSPNKSLEVQQSDAILKNILNTVDDDLTSPLFKSILGKVKEVEAKGLSDAGKKCLELFRMLTEEEKEYLRPKRALQKGPTGDEFSITFKYYPVLLLKATLLKE